jgi:hypothetical protein
MVAVAFIVTAAILDRDSGELLNRAWPALLLTLWLIAASNLIDFAHNAAGAFEQRATSFLSGRDVSTTPWLQQTKRLADPLVVRVQTGFVTLGVTAAFLTPAPVIWRLAWAVTVGATFFYAGIGLWGAAVVTNGVRAVAHAAAEDKKLNMYHADRLAGLGFAVRYADVATLLLLTGASAFPMALLMAQSGLRARGVAGYVLAGMVAALLIIWGGLTVAASLRSRGTIAKVVEALRDSELDTFAVEKRELIGRTGTKDQLEILKFKEDAAGQLRVGLFSGAGAWKDLFSVGAATLSIVDLYGSFTKALSVVQP